MTNGLTVASDSPTRTTSQMVERLPTVEADAVAELGDGGDPPDAVVAGRDLGHAAADMDERQVGLRRRHGAGKTG